MPLDAATASLIGAVLPPSARSAEAFGWNSPVALYPEEAATVEKAVSKRRAEFAAGRALARQLLREFGLEDLPIPVGEHRAPQWPPGFVGSITHCTGYCAAAVAEAAALAAIGIDAEPNAPLPDGVARLVLRPDEAPVLSALPECGVHWDRLTFSAKESVFKAWWPVTHEWLGFEDVIVEFDPATFEIRVAPRPEHAKRLGLISALTGRFTATTDLVVTAVTLPAGWQERPAGTEAP